MRLSPHTGLTVLMTAALSLGFVGFATAAPRAAFTSQQTSTIDGVGDYTSAALDGMGRTHVAYFDPSRHAWVADAGLYEVQVGSSSRDIRLKGAVRLRKEIVQPVTRRL